MYLGRWRKRKGVDSITSWLKSGYISETKIIFWARYGHRCDRIRLHRGVSTYRHDSSDPLARERGKPVLVCASLSVSTVEICRV